MKVGTLLHAASFADIVGTIAKLVKLCTLRITRDKLYFILSEQFVSGGIRIWCELPQVIMAVQRNSVTLYVLVCVFVYV